MTATSILPGIRFKPPYDQAKVELVTEGRRSYYVIDGQEYQRVTTVLNNAIPKPALVPWARDQALMSVQTELRRHIDTDERITEGWIDNVITQARAKPDQVKDEAANWGTRAHACIAAMLRNQSMENTPEWSPDLAPALEAFVTWQSQVGIIALDVERTVWDVGLKVAGTCDGIGQDRDNRPVVWDVKTGKHLYPEHALQVSAYSRMLQGLMPIDLELPRAFIIRLPHEKPTNPGEAFEAKEVRDIDRCWHLFRIAYEISQGIKSQLWV